MTNPWERQPRIDSTEEQTRIAEGVNKIIYPPSNVPLDDCDLPFFHSVIDEFARSDWSPHQLELAAILARCMADLVEDQRMLRDEGSIVRTEKGTPVANPRKSVVQMNAGTILAIRRSLSLNAVAGTTKKAEGQRKASAKAAQELIEEAGIEGDDGDERDDRSLLAGFDA